MEIMKDALESRVYIFPFQPALSKTRTTVCMCRKLLEKVRNSLKWVFHICDRRIGGYFLSALTSILGESEQNVGMLWWFEWNTFVYCDETPWPKQPIERRVYLGLSSSGIESFSIMVGKHDTKESCGRSDGWSNKLRAHMLNHKWENREQIGTRAHPLKLQSPLPLTYFL